LLEVEPKSKYLDFEFLNYKTVHVSVVTPCSDTWTHFGVKKQNKPKKLLKM